MVDGEAQLYLVSHNRTKNFGIGSSKRTVERMPDFWKIGIATDPERRLSVMQSGSPHKLRLETTIGCDDAEAVETHLHRINRPLHKRGEWFRVPLTTRNSLHALDRLEAENVKVVSRVRSTGNWDYEKGFYVQLMEVRNGNLTLDERGLPSK
jgi:hypothetical protein